MKRLLWLLLFSALSLAACGDGGQSAGDGSVLHRGTGEEPESLDVHKSRSTEAGHVQRDLGEGLVGYSPDGKLQPAAAESWTISDDGTEYRFQLRSDARWSNGDPVTADDFVYSFRRLVDPDTAAFYVDSVREVRNAAEIISGEQSLESLGIEAVGEHQLKITLRRPVPYFINLLAHPSTFPVHRGSIAEHGDAHSRPGNLVSNGAYKLTSWVVGSHIEIERNEYYRDNDNTAIDRVFHYVTPEPMAELNRYRAGELHVTRGIPPELFIQMKEERPDEVRVSPALGVYYYGFNMSDPDFADSPKLREALSMAIDREQLVELIGRGEAPAYGWVPNGTANYDPQTYSWSSMSAGERITKAQQLYREAGYGPNRVFRTEIRYNTNATHRTVAVAIQSMWKTVLGVDAELVSEEFQVLLQNIQQKDSIKIFRLNWDGDYNDAHTFLSTFETDNPSNLTGYQSDEFDSLMQRAASQTDPRLRKAYLEEAEVRMLRDHPMIPIYFFVNKHMVSPSVIGWGDNVLNYHYSQHLSFAADE